MPPPEITRLKSKFYNETMGKRKQEIIANIRKRVDKIKEIRMDEGTLGYKWFWILEVKKFNNVSIKFPTLTNRMLKDGFTREALIE